MMHSVLIITVVHAGSLRSGSGRSSRGGLNSPVSDSSQLSAGIRGSPPVPPQVSRLHKMALLETSETYSPTSQHRNVGGFAILFNKTKLVTKVALLLKESVVI
jgi:hypothetical protein